VVVVAVGGLLAVKDYFTLILQDHQTQPVLVVLLTTLAVQLFQELRVHLFQVQAALVAGL
jgi:hypothetical protein